MLTKKVADVTKGVRARTKIKTYTVFKTLGKFHVYNNIPSNCRGATLFYYFHIAVESSSNE